MHKMWFIILIGMSFVTPPALTREAWNDVFPCSRGVNSLDEFRCQNGTGCVSVKHMCDGIPNCSDESDEEFCPLVRSILHTEESKLNRSRRQLTKSGGCVLPPYPTYGTYEVSKFPNARPGQALDSFVLTISCRQGFGVVDLFGVETMQQLYCVNGEYQYQSVPRCVRFCKLNPDPSVRYTCHVPGVGFKTCPNYVAPGTLVNPICNSPIYYSIESLSYMKCNFGFWDYVAQCRAECGRVTPEGGELIIDGKQAKRGELPWHVAVYRKTTKPYTQICSGTLITNNVVLSAAHCFWSGLWKTLPASDFAVAAGKLYRDWDSENDVGAQKSELIEIRIPSRFQGATANFQEDIAAMILKTPFVYMTYVRPVCLYYDVNFERIQLQQGNLGKVAGWGLTSTQGTAANTLQVIEMPFVNVDTCLNTLPESFREYITGDKFCAGNISGKALCKGDSGGGLAFPDRGLGVDRYYLRGIVSTAPKDDQKQCNDYVYTTFTMITKHQDFIKEALAASAEKKCPQYSFQCDDGSCVDQGADCNGRQDCADGSDETDELCRPGPMNKICILPSYPDYGTYETNIPNSRPGQSFESIALTVTCQKGYQIMTSEGVTTKNGTTVDCVMGNWQQNMPKCVRFCKLDLDPSVRHICAGRPCKTSIAPGTVVTPICNSPIYYSTEVLLNMTCIDGSWDYVARCRADCGRVTLEGVTITIDGNQVQRPELPWHVGIYRKTSESYKQICGGSLVSDDVVISAAHCVWSDLKKLQPASEFAVAVGKLYRKWNDSRDIDAQESNVKKISIPSLFQGAEANFQEDIAILILTTSFLYRTFVRPVCLNYEHIFDRRQLQHGNLGKIAGWSFRSADGVASQYLQVVQVPFISDEVCVKTLPRSFRPYITGDKFCAGYTNGTSVCRGDSGGGLAFPEREQGIDRYYLRGIISTAPRVEDSSCGADSYTVFTKIAKHQEFIENALEEAIAIKTCPRGQEATCNPNQEFVEGFEDDRLLNKSCILPPYPKFTYYETNIPKSRPGQSFDSIALTVTCQKGLRIMTSEGVASENSTTVYCIRGVWYQNMPKCVRFCILDPDPSVHYICAGRPCKTFIAPGTVVNPICNSPNYYSTEVLPNMTCKDGARDRLALWDYVARCTAVKLPTIT